MEKLDFFSDVRWCAVYLQIHLQKELESLKPYGSSVSNTVNILERDVERARSVFEYASNELSHCAGAAHE